MNLFKNFQSLSLDLSTNKLLKLDNEFISRTLNNLKELYLHHNDIESLDEKCFEYCESLVILDLSYNKLVKIEKNYFFEGLNNLKELYLNHNAIKSLDDKCFEYCESLVILDLSYNELMKIENQFISLRWVKIKKIQFSGLFKLKELYLHHNNIQSLNLGCFENFRSLVILNLSYNKILEIDNQFKFSGLVNLKELYLHHNNIQSLDEKSFLNCPSLVILDLSFNKLVKIENQSSFSYLANLKELYLHHNDIENLDKNCFYFCMSLVILDLSYNKLKKIENQFNSFNLKELYLHHNHIENLDQNCFYFCRSLVILDLSDNQFYFDLRFSSQVVFVNLHVNNNKSISDLFSIQNTFELNFSIFLKNKELKHYQHNKYFLAILAQNSLIQKGLDRKSNTYKTSKHEISLIIFKSSEEEINLPRIKLFGADKCEPSDLKTY